MKLAVVVQIVVLCVVLTVFSIFTIDSVSVRKAELLEILSVDVKNIAEDYFEGSIETADLEGLIQSSITSSAHSKADEINVSVYHASAEQGLVDVLVEVTYTQPNGRPRMLSYKRVYILEKQQDPEAKIQYSFVRNIDASHYKSPTNDFIPESNGGLKEDSIWKTDLYSSLLDSALIAE